MSTDPGRHWLVPVTDPENPLGIDDPVRWCLGNLDLPMLAPARDDLAALAGNEADRILSLLVRRCGVNLVVVRGDRVVGHHWGQTGRADLRPLLKRLRLARYDVRVVVRDRKRGSAVVGPGTEYLYGAPAADGFPWDEYRRQVGPDEEWSPVPGSQTDFGWPGVAPWRLPWVVLRLLWGREPAPLCPNCDVPQRVVGFGFVFSKSTWIIRACWGCERRFKDRGRWVVNWLTQHLDRNLWPTGHRQVKGSIAQFLSDAAGRPESTIAVPTGRPVT